MELDKNAAQPAIQPGLQGGADGLAQGLELKNLDINLVKPNPNQPRKVFDAKGLESLAASLSKDGFLQPLVVRAKDTEGFYPLVAGERRLRAARSLGLLRVPAVIKPVEGADNTDLLALIENIQRKDLGALEEARAYRELIDEHSYTQEECARELGVDRSKVTNYLRLLSLPEALQESLASGEITMGHARALLSLRASRGLLFEAHGTLVKKGLSVRQTELLCRKLLRAKGRPFEDEGEKENPNIEYVTDALRQKLKTKVRLLGSGVRGKIEISYFSPAEFERILGHLGLQ